MPKQSFLRAILLIWALSLQAEAATLVFSYGALEEESHRQYFYTLEAFQNQGGLTDFEIISLNHAKGETRQDSVEFLSRGLGFTAGILRLNADAGFLFSMDKYALDEIDYGISRGVLGLGLNLNSQVLSLQAVSRSYIPFGSAKARIDSFDLTFNPYPYRQSEIGLTLRISALELQAEVGMLDNLKGRYDILAENFMLSLSPVTYARAALVLKGDANTLLRLELHKVLDDHDRREEFHKLIGSAIHRDAYDGGSLGIGIAF